MAHYNLGLMALGSPQDFTPGWCPIATNSDLILRARQRPKRRRASAAQRLDRGAARAVRREPTSARRSACEVVIEAGAFGPAS